MLSSKSHNLAQAQVGLVGYEDSGSMGLLWFICSTLITVKPIHLSLRAAAPYNYNNHPPETAAGCGMVFTTYNYCNNSRVAENVRNVLAWKDEDVGRRARMPGPRHGGAPFLASPTWASLPSLRRATRPLCARTRNKKSVKGIRAWVQVGPFALELKTNHKLGLETEQQARVIA